MPFAVWRCFLVLMLSVAVYGKWSKPVPAADRRLGTAAEDWIPVASAQIPVQQPAPAYLLSTGNSYIDQTLATQQQEIQSLLPGLVQRTLFNSQSQQQYVNPQQKQVQQIPQTQQVHRIPQSQQIHHIPQSQQVHQIPQTQQVHQIPQSQQVHQIPQSQQVHQIPQSQQVHQIPQSQQIHQIPQSQQIQQIPQQVQRVPQTQPVQRIPQTQQVQQLTHAQQIQQIPQIQHVQQFQHIQQVPQHVQQVSQFQQSQQIPQIQQQSPQRTVHSGLHQQHAPQLLQPVLPQPTQPQQIQHNIEQPVQHVRKSQRSRKRTTTTTTSTTESPAPSQEVQLLYVPVETLLKQQKYIPEATTTAEPPTTTTLEPYQPPLSVYMEPRGDQQVKITDVIRVLKEAKTVSVLDTVGPESPQVFVGPSNLQTPNGYAKFELPYLSSLESNRVERKVDKHPFFVAPLSFKPPPGYSKIPFPAPHVGSVVVGNVTEKPKTYSLPAELPPISPELPSLVNSLVLSPQQQLLHAVQQVGLQTDTTTRSSQRVRSKAKPTAAPNYKTVPEDVSANDQSISSGSQNYRIPISSEGASSINQHYKVPGNVEQVNYRVPSENSFLDNEPYLTTVSPAPTKITNYRVSQQGSYTDEQESYNTESAVPREQENYSKASNEFSSNLQHYQNHATAAKNKKQQNLRTQPKLVPFDNQNYQDSGTEIPVKQPNYQTPAEDELLYQQRTEVPTTVLPVRKHNYKQQHDDSTVQNSSPYRVHPDQEEIQVSNRGHPVQQTNYNFPSGGNYDNENYQIQTTEVPEKKINYKFSQIDTTQSNEHYVPATELPSSYRLPSRDINPTQKEYQAPPTEVPVKQINYRVPSRESSSEQFQYSVTELPKSQTVYEDALQYNPATTISPIEQFNYKSTPQNNIYGQQKFQEEDELTVSVNKQQTYHNQPQYNQEQPQQVQQHQQQQVQQQRYPVQESEVDLPPPPHTQSSPSLQQQRYTDSAIERATPVSHSTYSADTEATTHTTTTRRNNRGRHRHSDFSTTTSVPRSRNSYSRTRRPVTSRTTSRTPTQATGFESSREQTHRFETRSRSRSRGRTTSTSTSTTTTTTTTPPPEYIYQDDAFSPSTSTIHSRLDTITTKSTNEPYYNTDSNVQFSSVQNGNLPYLQYSAVQTTTEPVRYSTPKLQLLPTNVQYSKIPQRNHNEPVENPATFDSDRLSVNQYSVNTQASPKYSDEDKYLTLPPRNQEPNFQFGAQRGISDVRQDPSYVSTESTVQQKLQDSQILTEPDDKPKFVRIRGRVRGRKVTTTAASVQDEGKVTRGSSRHSANLPSVEVTTPANNKIYTVRPQRRQQAAPTKLTTRGRIRRPSTTTPSQLNEIQNPETTTSRFQYINSDVAQQYQPIYQSIQRRPTAQPNYNRDQEYQSAFQITQQQTRQQQRLNQQQQQPITEFSSDGQDYQTVVPPHWPTERPQSGPQHQTVAPEHQPASAPQYQLLQPTAHEQVVPGRKQYQPANPTNDFYQFTGGSQQYQSEQQYLPSEQQYQVQQLGNQPAQKNAYPAEEHVTNTPEPPLTFKPATYQTVPDTHNQKATQQYQNYKKYDGADDQQSDTSNYKYTTIQRQHLPIPDRSRDLETESTQAFSPSAINNLLQSDNKTYTATEETTLRPETSTDATTTVAGAPAGIATTTIATTTTTATTEEAPPLLTTLSSTTVAKKPGHGQRRGSWVRVRVRPQQNQDIFETAESQNVATVSGANMLSFSSTVKEKNVKDNLVLHSTTTNNSGLDVHSEPEKASSTTSLPQDMSESTSTEPSFGETSTIVPSDADLVHTEIPSTSTSSDDLKSITTTISESENEITTTVPVNLETATVSSGTASSNTSSTSGTSEDEQPESYFGSLLSSIGNFGEKENENGWSDYSGWWGNTYSNHRPYYTNGQLSLPREVNKAPTLNSNIWDMDSFTEKHSVKKAGASLPTSEEPVTSTEVPDVTTVESITSTDFPVTTLIPPDLNIKQMDTESMMAQIVGTTTSTKISHETEICYRGRCIKTKTKDADVDYSTLEE
ncbi:hypothetical protein C0J52_06566 [Blattella germanica]|nr:hypothetical protein C0J52_06566 [Blattella germanica]